MKIAVFIDMQNDFLKGGKLAYAYPEHDISKDVIAFAKECRSKGWQLYATADTHEKTCTQNATFFTSELGYVCGYLHTLEGQKLPVEHCIRDTEGHKIAEGLVKDENNDVIIPQGHIIDKLTFGSFNLLARIDQDFVVDSYGNLTQQSKYDGIGEKIDEIYICGVCSSICVVSNALMLRAKYPNVRIVVYENLCGDISKESHDAAMKVMQNCQIDIAWWSL